VVAVSDTPKGWHPRVRLGAPDRSGFSPIQGFEFVKGSNYICFD